MGHNHNQEKNIASVGKPYKAQIGSEPTETLVGLNFCEFFCSLLDNRIWTTREKPDFMRVCAV